MISQLTIFLQNEKGHLASACREIADADINMYALFIADTQEFGIARIFCDNPDLAAESLTKAGFRATVTQVCAVRIPQEPGSLAHLLEYCDEQNLNLEYGYCFSIKESAVDVLKIDGDDVEEKLIEGGFEVLPDQDVYAFN